MPRRDWSDVAERLLIAHLTTVDMSHALLLATELRVDLEAGHDVVALSSPGPYVADIERLGVRHVAIPSFSRTANLRSDARGARELWSALRGLRPDVLHTHTPKAGVIGRVVGRVAGVPVVVNTCHGLWASPDDPLIKRGVVVAVEMVAARFSHAELYQNDVDRRRLRRAVPERRAEVVGNGIDLTRFRYDPDGRQRVRGEWGIGEDELVVGGVGRVVGEKGIAELAVVADRLGPRARVVWVGPEDEAKPLPVAVRGPDAIDFVGPRADMPAVYSALDVFVLPSHREGFSRSAMEAAACARPMVLSDIRGCREIGTNGEHLLLVPQRDPAALLAAIERLLGDDSLRARLGSAAAHRASAEFDQRRVAARSLETYRAVLARRRR